MTGQDGGFPQAAARFTAEVDRALTRAKRAARDARAQSEEFRRSTGELAAQAKKGKLRGVRRGAVAATSAAPREQAVEFRNTNGLPVEELPDADALMARLPGPDPDEARKPENDDFSQEQVLFDIDERSESVGVDERSESIGVDERSASGAAERNGSFDVDERSVSVGDRGEFAETGRERDFGDPAENGRAGDEPSRASDEDEDFSQQRILLDATVESYRPDGMLGAVFEPREPDERRSEGSSGRRSDSGD